VKDEGETLDTIEEFLPETVRHSGANDAQHVGLDYIQKPAQEQNGDCRANEIDKETRRLVGRRQAVKPVQGRRKGAPIEGIVDD
jgi:hypothetical protein